MKYSGHRKPLCKLSKWSKCNAFNLLGYKTNADTSIFVSERTVFNMCAEYATAIYFPCITILCLPFYRLYAYCTFSLLSWCIYSCLQIPPLENCIRNCNRRSLHYNLDLIDLLLNYLCKGNYCNHVFQLNVLYTTLFYRFSSFSARHLINLSINIFEKVF